jgi:NDP-hexose C3-ketoreductase / dTDP-4-oxo-2-deoxy-alpha-D-pentos-2-ene 2,3-reductase
MFEGRWTMYTQLGRTALKVSRLCLGTVNFGVRVDEPEGHKIMNVALDHGINFFDTANMYGWGEYHGYAEDTIGRWFKLGGQRRDNVVLATKVGWALGGPNNGGLSARHIVKACEDSLRRLHTDWLDLYQMHVLDRTAPWEEIWQAMEMLVGQGKVRYVGSSNFAGWNLVAAQESANRRNFLGIVSEQCLYNLVKRHVELEVIPAARAYGIAVLPWSPLHGGLLGGVLRKVQDGSASKSVQGRAAAGLEEHRSAVEEYEKFCAELGDDPAQTGLSWVLSRPGVTSAVIGPRTVDQLEGALAAVQKILSDECLSRLDEIFPPIGSGGPAPEAWKLY